ncbi:MAG: TldD/PmbA family protein [Thermoprotei archaeon]|nr:MAG: TldD/PmbA family protein [Thermoprotei archaeon]
MSIELLSNLSSKIISLAQEKNVSETEFYGKFDDIIQVEISSNGIGKVISRSIGKYALRIAIGKKVGLVYSENIDEKSIPDIVEKAISITKTTPEDKNWPGFPRGYSSKEGLKVYDKVLASITPENLIEFLGEVIDTSIDNARKAGALEAIVTRGYLGIVRSGIYIENSYGDSISGSSTALYLYYNIHVKNDEGDTAYPFTIQIRRLDKDKIFSKVAETANLAVKFIGAKPIDSGKYQLLIMPEVHGELVETVFSPAVSAYSIQRNRSPLKDKVGEQIFSEEVTIFDDPHMDYGFGSRPFDDEGIMTTSKPLVDHGVFENIVYDHYTASIEGKKSTGNAVRRRLNSVPAPEPLNIVFKARNAEDLESMIGMIKRGIIVYGVIGSWMSNPVNGAIQATVTHGLYVENGEIKHPVKGVVMGGNYYNYLKQDLMALGKDIENYGHIYAIPILVDKVPIAGK